MSNQVIFVQPVSFIARDDICVRIGVLLVDGAYKRGQGIFDFTQLIAHERAHSIAQLRETLEQLFTPGFVGSMSRDDLYSLHAWSVTWPLQFGDIIRSRQSFPNLLGLYQREQLSSCVRVSSVSQG